MTDSSDLAEAQQPADRINLVGHVELECQAVLGHGTMTVSQLNTLSKGDFVALDRTPADPVDIVVNGKTIARGEIVTADGHFAVRITEIS
jgi:flagellar motor switch protein FliN/FliY